MDVADMGIAREICLELVADYIAAEVVYFDTVWEALQAVDLATLGCKDPDGAIAKLGAIGGQTGQRLDSVAMVALFCCVLRQLQGKRILTTQGILKEIHEASDRLDVPLFIKRVFIEEPGIFARAMRVVDWQERRNAPRELEAKDEFLVDFCEKWGDPPAKASQSWFSEEEIRSKFLADGQRENAVLLVDDAFNQQIFVRPPTSNPKVYEEHQQAIRFSSWREGTTIVLGWLLDSLRTGFARYDIVTNRLVGQSTTDRSALNKISRIKGLLNKKLHGIVDQLFEAEPGSGYRQIRSIPYCWIRESRRGPI